MRWMTDGVWWHLVDPRNWEIGPPNSVQGFALCMN